MAQRQADLVLRHLRQLAGRGDLDELPDRQLLDRFADEGDRAALEALVRRHAPMVLGVCRRVLRDAHAAEDAFQATFLILVRKAAALRRRELFAGWLYGVARRVAARTRVEAARRTDREARARPRPPADPAAETDLRELCAVLEEELARLAERYRVPFHLCYVEGLPRDKAARRLGCSVRTLQRLLERGRALLQSRLSRRGVTLSAALLAATLPQGGATGAVPAALVSATVRAALASIDLRACGKLSAAAALAEGVLGRMPAARTKFAALFLLVLGILAGGVALLAHAAPAPEKPAPERHEPPGRRAGAAPPQARADLFGDPLPPGALVRLGTVRFRHHGAILATAFAPSGKVVAGAGWGEDCAIRFWEAATGKEIRRLPGNGWPVSALAFSPDGKTFAAGGEGIRLWDAATGKPLYALRIDDYEVRALAFSPNGKRLASTGEFWNRIGSPALERAPAAVELWEAATGKLVHKLQGHRGHGRALAFASDGKTLASGGSDRTIRLWEVATGKERRCLSGHGAQVTAVAFSPDGTQLASAGGQGDPTVRLWQPGTGREVRRFKAHPKRVAAVAFSPDGQSLASGGDDGTVRLWDPATGKKRGHFVGPEWAVSCLAFSPDGKALAAGGDLDYALHLWPLPAAREARPLAGHQAYVYSIAFSPDGKQLATAGWDRVRSVRLWDAATGKELRQLGAGRGQCFSVSFSPNGQLLAAGGADGDVRLHDAATGAEIRRLPGHEKAIWSIAFSPDGRLLASGGNDPLVRLWDVAAGKLVRHLAGGPEDVATPAVAFSPDGKLLASGHVHEDLLGFATLCLWDVATGREVRRLRGHQGMVDAVAFSPDGQLLASWGDLTGEIFLWEVATGKEIRRLRDGPEDRGRVGRIGQRSDGRALAFSPDGKTLAIGVYTDSSVLQLWDVASGKERLRLKGHHGPIGPVAFSPAGNRLATGSEDTTVLIWDVSAVVGGRRLPEMKRGPGVR